MKAIKIAAVLFALMSLALPGIANAFALCTADTVDVVYDSFGANDIITIWGGTNDGDNVYAGVYMLNKTGGTGEGNIWPNGLIGGFCIELQEDAPYETHTYSVVTPDEVYNSFLGTTLGTKKADYLSELWGRFFDPEWMSGGPYSSKQNKYAEAFAAAIWEIVYEDLPKSPLGWDVGTDGTSGSCGFLATNVDKEIANNWLHALTGCGPKADLRAFVFDGKQDYLVQVPEPMTIALLGIAGSFCFVRRRRADLKSGLENRQR